MPVKTLLLAALALASLVACHVAPSGVTSRGAAERGLTLVFLKTGPMSGQLPKERNDELFQGHFANMNRMAEEGKLLVAGPFGKVRHDQGLRGLFILDTARRAEAQAWASTDPPTQAGVFQLEYHDLATSAPLRKALEADTAWRAEQEAQGRKPDIRESLRNYVLVSTESAALLYREFGPLRSSAGGVYLLGHLDGTGGFALLDAESVEAARERFKDQLRDVGRHELDEWFASIQLARLNDL